MRSRGLVIRLLLAGFVLGTFGSPPMLAQPGPTVIEPVFAGESPRLSQLLASQRSMAIARAGEIEDAEVPNPEFLFPGSRDPKALGPDPARQRFFPEAKAGARLMLPLLSFEGMTADDNADLLNKRPVPPDTNGDVSPDHYAQMNNNVGEIFDKDTGESVTGPFPNNIFFAGTGSYCEEKNDGDPIVLYDHASKRWIFSQFAIFDSNGSSHQCFAISQTRDPLGAYYLYDYVTAIPQVGGQALNDYEKLGVWRDGIYYSHNEFELRGNDLLRFAVAVIAFDKKAMYRGDSNARGIKFIPASPGPFNIYLLPSHWEGKRKPRPGAPNIFWQAIDEEVFGDGTGVDGYRRWAFHADFRNPESSTFIELPRIPSPPYNTAMPCERNCFDQPAPGRVSAGQGLDDVGMRLMYRAQWRSFGSYDAVVLNHTVNADGFGTGGIRWVELRDHGAGFELFQTGTFAPDDGDHRFMGSIAQDGKGNIALGYSVTGRNTFPSVRYTGRAASDPPGQMQTELECHAGRGVQVQAANRWGDYSTMSVDPEDDCTFWYTQEYYQNKKRRNFKTRVCAFRFEGCRGAQGSGQE